jgi:thiol-disulfide isomerase/thioredoxin
MIGMCFWMAGICPAQSPVSGQLEKANDFTYTMASGRQGTLYALQAEVILLYFYDPECEDCHALTERLNGSEAVNRLVGDKRMEVLAVYPEEATAEWLAWAEQMPPAWINGYDKGAKINTEGLYPMKTLPALYLLDAHKNIRLKEATAEETECELKRISNN